MVVRWHGFNRISIILLAMLPVITLMGCDGKNKASSGIATGANSGTVTGSMYNEAPGQDGKSKSSGKRKESEIREIKNICILYTGNAQGAMDNAGRDSYYYDTEHLTYSSIAGYKHEQQSLSNAVFVVDAGGSMSGSKYTKKTEGMTAVELMNAVGYNVATPNEYDLVYGLDRFKELNELNNAAYISCNLYHVDNGVGLLPSYCILESGGVKVAFVGITSPSIAYEDSDIYNLLCNEEGEKLYDVLFSEDGDRLYSAVQKAVDTAKKQSDYVVAISNLGTDEEDDLNARPSLLSSGDVIMNTRDIDVFIDTGSDLEIESKMIPNVEGKMVLLTVPGKKLSSFGEIKISKSGKISSRLIDSYDYRDDKVYELEIKCMGD